MELQMAAIFRSRAIHLIKKRCQGAVDYKTYRLKDRSAEHDRCVTCNISNWTKTLQTTIRSHKWEAFNHVFIVRIFSGFKHAGEFIAIHEGTDVWLFQFFLKEATPAAIDARISSANTGVEDN